MLVKQEYIIPNLSFKRCHTDLWEHLRFHKLFISISDTDSFSPHLTIYDLPIKYTYQRTKSEPLRRLIS